MNMSMLIYFGLALLFLGRDKKTVVITIPWYLREKN